MAMVKRPRKKGAQTSRFDLERATAALEKLPTDAARHEIDPRRSFVEFEAQSVRAAPGHGWTVSRIVKALAEEGVVLPAKLVRESLLTEEQLRLDRERRRGTTEKEPSAGE